MKHSKRSTELHVANQSKTNPKEFYSFIRQKRLITSTIGPIIDVKGDYTNDEEHTSNILNTFFGLVFKVEDLNEIPTAPAVQSNDNDVLSSIIITESDLSQCFDKHKVSKSPGPDTISPRILKKKRNLK